MTRTSNKREASDTGATENAALGIAHVGETLTRMRLLIRRRIIGRIAIANIAPELELSHLDVLEVMKRINKDGGETTVGAIADAMRIDPSQGSRIVAELVTRGVVRRVASQADGRRSVIERTELGDRLIGEVRAVKQALVAEVMRDWSTEDVEIFSLLFERFVERFETLHPAGERQEE